MRGSTGINVVKVSLLLNSAFLTLIIMVFSPAALLIGLFLLSLWTEDIFTLEDPLLFALQPLILLFALVVLLFCLIITVGCRVYAEVRTPLKERKKVRLGHVVLVLSVGSIIIIAVLLMVLGATGSMEAGEAIALWILFMFGLLLLSINYGLATLHLYHFEGETWAEFHRGLSRLPPLLLLLGFPAVVLLELPENVPFITVLFVFCWSILLISLVTTLVTNVRTYNALRTTPDGPGSGRKGARAGPTSGRVRRPGPF